jgi:peptide/nickel transport system substrate-binding protein
METRIKRILSEDFQRVTVALIFSLLLLLSSLYNPVYAAPPPISRPYQFTSLTDLGAAPETVDPAWCYDSPSCELIFNVYETLVFFNGEHMDTYLPQLATEWTIVNTTGVISPEGLQWNWTYYFKLRNGVQFQNPAYTLTTSDVEYSLERVLVMDRFAGPAWTLYEPLLGVKSAYDLGDLNNPVDIQLVGKMIDHAVESNSTHVWLNLAFPSAYAPLMQILCQPWCSILSKQWVNDYVIGMLGRPDWNGDWNAVASLGTGVFADHSAWINYHDPAVSPLDTPTPIMMGTGPFRYDNLDPVDKQWSISRFLNYWRGWPAPWPVTGASKPAGYVDQVVVSWAYTWMTQSAMFRAGQADFLAVPKVVQNQIMGSDGIRTYYPLPELALDAYFFTFDISPSSPYENIFDYNVLGETGIPRNLFSDIHVRKAFAHLFNFTQYLAFHYQNEGMIPATAIIPGLPYYDSSVQGYDCNLEKAADEFKLAFDGRLWNTGFTLALVDNTNWGREHINDFIIDGLSQIVATVLDNPKFHVYRVDLDWPTFLRAMRQRQLPEFPAGWTADYPDAHNFAFPFYHSEGTFAQIQGYSNPVMDALIDLGIRTPNGPARQAIYTQIQKLAIQDCPSVAVIVPIGRHWERDWVVGWYWNPLYGGSLAEGLDSTEPASQALYFYNMWKWYYIPHAQYDTTPPQPVCNYLPYDINYDGKINMIDIGSCAASFGTLYGPPMSSKWNFRCDVSNDRKIDMKDIGMIAKNFGKTSTIWVPPLP